MNIFLMTLLLTSLSMSVVILLLALINNLLVNKIRASFRYYTWLIVLVGLLIPFRPSISVPFKPTAVPMPTGISQTSASFEVLNEALNRADRVNESEQSETLPVEAPVLILDSTISKSNVAAVSTISENHYIPYALILFGLWVAGVLSFLAFHIRAYIKFTSSVRRWGVKAEDESLLSIMRETRENMGLSGKLIAVKTYMLTSSPMLIGFFNPTILLPENEISQDELEHVFRHELIHYKRRDLWINLLVLLTSAAHWFNPVVYLMAKAIRTDCEASCDEMAVAGSSVEKRKHYGETILGFISAGNARIPVLSTYFYGGSNHMKKRLLSIMDTNRKNTWLAMACAMGVVMTTMLSSSVFAAASDTRGIVEQAPQTPVTTLLVKPDVYGYPPAQANITPEAAQISALARVGGGTVARTETRYLRHGGMEYKVIVVNGDYKYNVHINAYDGNIINYHMDQITKARPRTYYSNTEPVVSADRAKSVAIQNAGGGIVTDCNLDYKPHIGALTYHIHVANGQYEYCLELDAATGVVYKVEQRHKP
jgi:beta-lactamase regulating signal transducer with metallopeptidase domain/uncharacterized membrane protein YkoI